MNYAAFPGQRCSQRRAEVESPHGNRSRHCNGVRHSGRNPDRAMRWNDPRAIVRRDRHHATRCKHELSAVVEMEGNRMTRGVIAGQCDDRRAAARQAIEDCGLSLFRHLLTQYRMSPVEENTSMGPSLLLRGTTHDPLPSLVIRI